MVDFPIDVVIPWVDGSDPHWIARKQAAQEKLGIRVSGDSTETRYRDWGLLRFVFRGIEQNAPWVRKVYLISDHQIPNWLDESYEKVQVISHEEYIPAEYLPTFSANTIELNIHRIKGLSEHFIYMNDDMFFTNPVKAEDFFTKEGLPKTTAIISPWKVTIGDYFFMPLVDAAVISRNFDFHKTIASHLGQWINFRYGINVFRTLLSLPYPYFLGFMEDHLPNAFLKSTFQEVWEKEQDVLVQTCKHQFRENTDVNQYLFREWQVAQGNFAPCSWKRGHAFQLRADWMQELQRCSRYIETGKGKLICLNDSSEIDDLARAEAMAAQMFSEHMPVKSRFER